jgi:neutral ceramidase
MKCGLYETDITPSLGSEIPGQFYMRISDGILDKLYAHAVYMCNNEGEKAVIVSCDAILIPDKTAEEARIAIAEKLDMKKECIMVVATHTHTGGPVETWDDFVHEDPRYIEFLRSRIVDAACMAHQVQRNVRIGYGKGYEDRIAYYRDYVFADGTYRTNAGMGGDKKPFGPIDPEVGVLRIDLPDGTPYGAIVNYTCHCDCVGGTKYSADYPGAMKETLKKVFGPSFIPVYINGFCGNINHLDFEKGFHQAPEHYKRMGRMLAAEVIRTRETAPLCDNVKIDGAHEYFTIPTRESAECDNWNF